MTYSSSPVGKLAADGIPLVNDKEKLLARGMVNGGEDVHEVGIIAVGHIGKRALQFHNNFLLNVPHEILCQFGASGKRRHVQINDAVFVEVSLERRVLLGLQAGEEFARGARLVIVGTQHLRRHRLAEAAAAGDATVAALRVERRVDQGNQRCLIHILVSNDVSEGVIASINICTHSVLSCAGEQTTPRFALQCYE